MIRILSYLALVLGLWGSGIFAYGLDSVLAGQPSTPTEPSLNSGSRSMSTGGLREKKTEAVEGSNVLLTAYSISPSSASEFLVNNIRQLEKLVSNYESLGQAEQKLKDKEIRKVVSSVLDLDHLGERSLISYWDELGKNPEGRKKREQYLNLFKNLVEENYLEKARTYMSGKYQIPLLEETAANGNGFSVIGRIRKPDVDLMVEFRILKDQDRYKVVDVRLDETSLESTYRGSFNRIIRKKGGLEQGFPELIRVMQKRLEELKTGNATRL
ncbi:MAG: hypothetical protein COV44_08815 [Deltaproteobacteria bacterium CG11_big_fil_rev_8_21_14_0_20_45_16]|nr:MAG: hypothetical protein COV44_08815 [Deltaproteobacteria bacterium CG11_big_fil_rev_8_21_14_0_20_45_16]